MSRTPGDSMSQSERLSCAGSIFSEPHSAGLPAAYSVSCPGGTVVYYCDVGCVERVLHAQARDVRSKRRGWRPLRTFARMLGTG